jgi:RNA 3'-terminal phosphate cyclase (GTP)
MIQIDGAYGEGGGQILRTALALSALTRMPFRATRIRRNRPQPGLKPQHLHCIRALEMWSGARAEGARPGADNVAFFPGRTAARELEIDIGTAGSVTLLLQALLPPMLFAGGSTRISVSGGTDTRWSIPLDYFIHVILPHFTEFAEITIRSTRRGFYPRGGGNLSLQIVPRISAPEDGLPVLLDAIAARFDPLSLHNAPEIIEIRGRSVASRPLQKSRVARRQAEGARRRLDTAKPLHLQEEYVQTESIGTVITLWAVGSDGRSRCGGDALGKRGVPAEAVGSAAAARLMAALESGAGVDHHLADNLIPLMALAGGTMVAERITGHIRASLYVCEQFLGPRLRLDERRCRITAERP